MKILIACEESQRVCTAFREKGHEAYSCDILTYCQYGDQRQKPTDIWTNHPQPNFKPPCKQGASKEQVVTKLHREGQERERRGSKTKENGQKYPCCYVSI